MSKPEKTDIDKLHDRAELEIQEVLNRFASDRQALDGESDVMVIDFAVAFTAIRVDDDLAISQYLMGPTTTAPHAGGLFDLGKAQIKHDFFQDDTE